MASQEATGKLLPLAIVEALKEVARSPEDPCCRIALDTLMQFAIRNPEAASSAAVLPIIIEAVIHPHFKAMQDSVLLVILYLLDAESTRGYFSNLSCILQPCTP